MTQLNFDAWINQSNAGFWEFDVTTNEVKWSDSFYYILGYEIGEIERSYLNFKDYLLYFEDRDLFLASINARNAARLKSVEIRLLTKRGYEWFQSTMQKQINAKITGTLVPIHDLKVAQLKSQAANSISVENNKLLEVVGWTLNCHSDELMMHGDAPRALDIPHNVCSLEDLIQLFEPADQTKLKSAIAECRKYSRPFEMNLLFRTVSNKKKWVKVKAYVRVDQFGNCIQINGTLQNIDWAKKKEARLEAVLNDLARQKDRLQNFAHIVAHNMNSYANNLKVMVDLYDQLDAGEERDEIFTNIKGISSSLKTTIDHLSEIVSSESQGGEKSIVEFEKVFNNTINVLYDNIQLADAAVMSDFSECPHVYYVPAYIESIFLNLISNSIKYRHPARKPVITCESRKMGGDVCLIFEDNGIGIDLDKYGEKLFGMYQTFHNHQDAHGIGLYITRNQIEQAGGTIHVESEVNKGTKFIIRLNATT